MNPWLVINALAFIGTPAGLLDGWVAYKNLPDRRSWRPKISFSALSCASLSVILLAIAVVSARLFSLQSTGGPEHLLIKCGIYMASAGAFASFAGSPRIIVPALLGNLGAFALWFGLTTP